MSGTVWTVVGTCPMVGMLWTTVGTDAAVVVQGAAPDIDVIIGTRGVVTVFTTLFTENYI